MTIRRITANEVDFLQDILYKAIFTKEGKLKLPLCIIEQPDLWKYIHNFGADKFDVCLVAAQDNQLTASCWGRAFG